MHRVKCPVARRFGLSSTELITEFAVPMENGLKGRIRSILSDHESVARWRIGCKLAIGSEPIAKKKYSQPL